MAHNNASGVANRETANPSHSSSIDRVSAKVPSFIPADPELWFRMLEGGFAAAGITQSSTKYGYVITALDQRYALEVRDILMREEQSYELLKTALIKRLGSSREQNTRRLLENEPLGDRKPSQFLRHLRGLAGKEFPEDVLQTLWLGRLPRHVQALLAAHRDLTLDKRADIADSIADLYGPAGLIAETSTPAPQPARAHGDDLIRVMAEMVRRLEAIEVNTQGARQPTSGSCEACGRSRSRSPSRSRFRSRSRSRSQRPDAAGEICWYHWQYGDKARKCEKPCKYSDRSPGNEQGSR
ncbi:uncharacterized protein LOC112639897 [Camponotus floridanus]|uniref:uncharacterized protein LOC112639897 n=1 Tax=Camponotus floridanus TaxID=104421 RepID=UPI000DC66D77|nr:uncharacterized protein LOC112639897 [Camponotus floridanus]